MVSGLNMPRRSNTIVVSRLELEAYNANEFELLDEKFRPWFDELRAEGYHVGQPTYFHVDNAVTLDPWQTRITCEVQLVKRPETIPPSGIEVAMDKIDDLRMELLVSSGKAGEKWSAFFNLLDEALLDIYNDIKAEGATR